jgi:hypothetical protein
VHLVAALAAVAIGVLLLLWAPWSAQASGDAPRASNVAMNCAPGQQALVRQSIVDGELNVLVECAAAAVPSAVAYGTEFVPTPALQPAYAPAAAPAVVPAVYSPPPAPRAPVYAPRPASQPRPATASRVEPKREWGKEALIIGGSAGAGAGIGGLIGGKKGALIGAAIGGGGAALYRVGKD